MWDEYLEKLNTVYENQWHSRIEKVGGHCEAKEKVGGPNYPAW